MVEFSKKNLVFSQANNLIEAKYSMSVGEMHLIFSVLSMIKKNDQDFKEYLIRVQDLAFLLEKSTKNVYREINKITDRLLSRVLYLKRDDNTILKCNWISSSEYKDGLLKIEISPKLKPYLLNLKNRFKKYELIILLNLKSSYSVKMYLLLKQYETIGKREFDLSEFKDKLCLVTKMYSQYKYIQKFVIKKVKKEFDKKDSETGLYLSDINFKLETIRTGRKITKLRFIIIKQKTKPEIEMLAEEKENNDKEPENNDGSKEIKEMISLGIKKKNAHAFIDKYGKEYIQEKLMVLKEMKEIKSVKSPSGFLISALEEDYKSEKSLEQEKKKERKIKEQEKSKKKKIESITNDLEKKFGKEERKKFIKSLSKEKEQSLLDRIKNEHEGNTFVLNKINEDGFNTPFVYVNIHNVIPNYKTNEEAYITQNLKELGLI